MSRRRFKIIVPGSTSNLGSGFDTVSAALGVYLKLGIETHREPGIVWPADWTFAEDENMILIGYRLGLRELGLQPLGLRIDVENQIPLQRGLGSSAAALIGGIRIAEYLAGSDLPKDRVLSLAHEIEGHPDNLAASLLGGWVISRVGSEGVKANRLVSRLENKFVVAIPEVTVSTAEARRILPPSYTLGDAVFNLQRVALLVHSVCSGDDRLLAEATRDRIHQPYRSRLVPGMEQILGRELLPEGLEQSLLSVSISGSGSTVLAMARDRAQEIGAWMVGLFEAAGLKATSLVLALDGRGARVIAG